GRSRESDLLAAGTVATLDGKSHFIVRRQAAGQSAWTTVDDFQGPIGFAGASTQIVLDNAGNLYLGGAVGVSSSSDGAWLVRRSTDRGQNWSTIDEYQFAPGK